MYKYFFNWYTLSKTTQLIQRFESPAPFNENKDKSPGTLNVHWRKLLRWLNRSNKSQKSPQRGQLGASAVNSFLQSSTPSHPTKQNNKGHFRLFTAPQSSLPPLLYFFLDLRLPSNARRLGTAQAFPLNSHLFAGLDDLSISISIEVFLVFLLRGNPLLTIA